MKEVAPPCRVCGEEAWPECAGMSREDAICNRCVPVIGPRNLLIAIFHLVAAALVELTAKPQEYESSFDYELDLVAGYMGCLGAHREDIYDTYDMIQHAVDREQRLGRL